MLVPSQWSLSESRVRWDGELPETLLLPKGKAPVIGQRISPQGLEAETNFLELDQFFLLIQFEQSEKVARKPAARRGGVGGGR